MSFPDPMAEQRRRFRLRGRVQGVGFRWFTTRIAEKHGVTGWVRNDPDGAVTCEAQGSAEQLRGFGEELQAGPPGSHVHGVETAEVETVAENGFRVTR